MRYAVEGWTFVGDIYNQIEVDLSFWWDAGYEHQTLIDRAASEAWDCICDANEMALLSAAGAFISIDKPRREAVEFMKFTSLDFDIRVGTFGTGNQYPSQIKEYGPFLYCPIFIDSPSFRAFYRRFEKKLADETGYGITPKFKITDDFENLPLKIVELYQSGEAVKRDDIKKRLAPNLKHDSWKLYWRQAVQMLPELKKPGPRSKG